jgi:hypothetical protein
MQQDRLIEPQDCPCQPKFMTANRTCADLSEIAIFKRDQRILAAQFEADIFTAVFGRRLSESAMPEAG